MRNSAAKNPSSTGQALLGFAVVAFLLLLSWGLGTGNIIATIISGAGIAIVIVRAGSILREPEEMRSQAFERTLRIASGTLNHLRYGLTPDGCNAICRLILPEVRAAAISITDTRRTLAYVGEGLIDAVSGAPISAPTSEVLESGRMQTFTGFNREEWELDDLVAEAGGQASHRPTTYPVGVVAPLVVLDRTVGTMKLFYRHGYEVDRAQLVIARGIAELLSTQLSAYALDRQAEMTAQAEIKALQAQINPHFLFNTLNTIAALTRTDPDRARTLLRDFSTFYRHTLQASQSLITLDEELEQTRRYLTIEQARFGKDRIIETEDLEPGCEDIRVPSFIVQPIVENAVRHAMRDEGPLHIDIQVATADKDVLIAVADDGIGMDERVAERLLAEEQPKPSSASKGTGIALRNVANRIEHYYGEGSGIEVVSKVGAGTCVTLRLVGVAPGSRR